ncbi:pro-resilin-like isoform X2 [Eriocheir sinensis]|uniref:pro-resilin-like isoform X2 n=1 Tax=Eriocheir sinensis TaxID=95602 RepID=UPI0021CA3DD0|nr:pro-resilin-like isoform X2 [Eriocheir sinensis]
MNSKVFFLLAGVAVALAAPDRPRTSYGPPRRDSSSFEHFSLSSGSAESFEHFRPASASAESFERFVPRYRSAESGSDESYESSEAKYDFQWAVNHPPSRNDFGQREGRDGDDTQGVYTVALPDGRRQTVTYHVDGDDGYIADVKYSGEARFPDYSRESGSYESRQFSSGSDESFETRRVYAPPSRSYLSPSSNESK